MFGLGKKDGDDDLVNDDCDKHDDDNCNDDSGDNTPYNVSIINFENLFSVSVSDSFCFQLDEGDLYSIVPCLQSCLAKSSLGLGA